MSGGDERAKAVNVFSRRNGEQRRGQSNRLTPEQEAALKEWASQGKIRTVWDAVDWVEQTFEVQYTYWGMHWVFTRLGLKKKIPQRTTTPQASTEEQEAQKKGVWLPT